MDERACTSLKKDLDDLSVTLSGGDGEWCFSCVPNGLMDVTVMLLNEVSHEISVSQVGGDRESSPSIFIWLGNGSSREEMFGNCPVRVPDADLTDPGDVHG